MSHNLFTQEEIIEFSGEVLRVLEEKKPEVHHVVADFFAADDSFSLAGTMMFCASIAVTSQKSEGFDRLASVADPGIVSKYLGHPAITAALEAIIEEDDVFGIEYDASHAKSMARQMISACRQAHA